MPFLIAVLSFVVPCVITAFIGEMRRLYGMDWREGRRTYKEYCRKCEQRMQEWNRLSAREQEQCRENMIGWTEEDYRKDMEEYPQWSPRDHDTMDYITHDPRIERFVELWKNKWG